MGPCGAGHKNVATVWPCACRKRRLKWPILMVFHSISHVKSFFSISELTEADRRKSVQLQLGIVSIHFVDKW